MTILTSLLLACAPTASPAPTAAPAKPAEVAKPAAPAAPAAAAPTRPTPKGAVTIVVAEEPLTMAGPDATAGFNNQIMRNFDEALLNRDPKTNELVGELATK